MRIKKTNKRVNICKCGETVPMRKFVDMHEGETVVNMVLRREREEGSKLFIGICPCGNQVFFRSYYDPYKDSK